MFLLVNLAEMYFNRLPTGCLIDPANRVSLGGKPTVTTTD